MKFNEFLNEYIDILDCTAKDLSEKSGLSAATLSRYRSGERVPEINSDAFESLVDAIVLIAREKQIDSITKSTVTEKFKESTDISNIDRARLGSNFSTLVTVMNINVSKLCKYTNYDASTVFRIRNGSRQPADPIKFVSDVVSYVVSELNSDDEREVLAKLLECQPDELSDDETRYEKLKAWLIDSQKSDDNIQEFLSKLNDFDLNEYIKAIHFDELKVPTLPFQRSTTKSYFGLKDMMTSELDFLKATVLSKSKEPVIMYSDMPMEEMSKDAEFPKKWMFGMAMMLKKGLHLNMIHNVDRPFSEMMLGLESYIPMYMTGQISPYYLKGVQNNAFLHLLKVSGAAALVGEAIAGYHTNGKYYLTKTKDEIAYYNKRARELLNNAHPLMDIYRSDSVNALSAFMLSDSHIQGKRRSILSTLPLYTMDREYLKGLLSRRELSQNDIDGILEFYDQQRQIADEILKSSIIEEEIPYLSKEEFKREPLSLSLSGMFFESDILYTYEEYLEHLNQIQKFAEEHIRYTAKNNSAQVFRNLQIIIHEGQWAMISKNKTPAIHFVIHHPRMREAIESFIPPVVEE